MPIRVPFDSLTLRAVSEELQRTVVGGAVQHIAQPSAADLILTVRHHGANHALTLSCDPVFARAHLTHVRRPNPPSPPAFCMLCRKYLEGGYVAAVAQRGFDRILDITVQFPDGSRYRLIAELMGKHSNLILVNEAGTILDAARRVTRRINRVREILPGLPYVSPPVPADRADPFTAAPAEIAALTSAGGVEEEALTARLMGCFLGLSPFLATEIARRAALGSLPEAWDELIGAARRREWAPVVIRNERAEIIGAYPFPTVQAPAEAQNPRESMHQALDHYYSTALPRAALDSLRHEMETHIERALRSRSRMRETLLHALEESARAEEYRQIGELILANLHRIEPGADSATVTDYYDPATPERTLVLDPDLTPQENAEAFFRRYRKARDGRARQQAQWERAGEDLRALYAAQSRLREARHLEELRALREEMVHAGLLRAEAAPSEPAEPARRVPDFQGKKIRTVVTPEGFTIYVGENSEANDYLTGRIASPNDLWLHVRAAASAHVVIRTHNRPESVPLSVIRRAALLAARSSAAKHSSLVPVDYTLKKYVRKPRGAAPGTVLYQNEKTIYVSPTDPEENVP